MSDNLEFDFEKNEQLPLSVFTEKAYLDYSMYVILDRALPHLGDGLKPVQRRIIYAMSELGLSAAAKHKKSARTVGDVLGKFHPHGDSACYEAMVLMAQPFAYRYPLIDGQGNWGSQDDPKSFAAMRYTEAKLAPIAKLLLQELEQGTVDWQPNFDGTLQEPVLLPARIPQVLLNGTTGIAVGMATDIPPHNLREIADACMALLDNPKLTVAELMQFIPAPDYPTGANIITPAEDLLTIYQTGNGSIKQRAVYQLESGQIAITALPHQVSGARIMEQIGQQMQVKKLPQLVDLRDESDHQEPTRIVLALRSNRVNTDELLAHLFATTDLEKNYRVNLNMIGLDGRPKVHDLRRILLDWLEFRLQVLTRRLEWRLNKVMERLHILAGFLIAYLNIDEVIRIIRTEDEPRPVLMQRFALSEQQAEAILNLRLRHLAKLEEIKLRAEQDELEQERQKLEQLLGSKARLKTLLKQELTADAAEYGDARRSQLIRTELTAQALDETALVSIEPMTVILSAKGWVRAAKGHEIDPNSLIFKSGDSLQTIAHGRSNQAAVFLDSTGRSYTLPVHTLPSARGFGEPLTGRLASPSGAEFVGVMLGQPESNWLLATDGGYGFIARLDDLQTRNKAGKAALTIPKGAKVLPPVQINNIESQYLLAISQQGYMLIIGLSELPQLPRGKGIKFINIPSAKFKQRDDYVAHMAVIDATTTVTVHAGKKYKVMTPAELQGYHGERARRGHKLPRGYQTINKLELE